MGYEREIEEKTIDLFRKAFSQKNKTGLFSDAGAMRLFGKNICVTIDSFSEKTHFPKQMTCRQRGEKAVAASISDLAAAGAQPAAISYAVSLPKKTTKSEIEKLAEGISRACRKHKIVVLKGDTKRFSEQTITISAIGFSEKPLSRKGAKPNQLVCVTGTLGDACCGHHSLVNNHGEKILEKKFLCPTPRISEGKKLASFASACTDVSDGLYWSLHELAKCSKTRFDIRSDKIPFSARAKKYAEKHGITKEKMLSFGEDYELIFTVDPAKTAKLSKLGTSVTVVGKTFEGEGVFVDGKKNKARGYTTF